MKFDLFEGAREKLEEVCIKDKDYILMNSGTKKYLIKKDILRPENVFPGEFAPYYKYKGIPVVLCESLSNGEIEIV